MVTGEYAILVMSPPYRKAVAFSFRREAHFQACLLLGVSSLRNSWDTEVQGLCSQRNRLRLDGDLTGLPVSNTSRTYPHAAFGHMDDDIRLGYQAGLVSLESPTYGRLWLSVTHHPGDTVSCTQAEALVLAAEARLQRRPRRRTELLRQRIHAFEQQVAQTGKRWETQQQAVKRAKERLAEAQQQVQEWKSQLDELEKD